MSNKPDKEGLIVSSLLAGAAIYFGLSKKGSRLEDLARAAVGRVIDDQINEPREALGYPTQQALVENSSHSKKQRIKRRFKK
jgi:hypothetical protein